MTFDSMHLVPYVNHTSAKPSHAPYQLFQYGSDPEASYQRIPSPILRPLPTAAIKLQDPRLKCDRNLGWNIDWAVAFIIDHLDRQNLLEVADIPKSILMRAEKLETEGFAREISYHAFNKLDEALFAGHLKSAIFLDIRDLGSNVSGATHSPGWGPDPKVKRISIVLDGNVPQPARPWEIVAAFIHHMIHAYFLVACGSQLEMETEYGRLGHGLHLGKIMMTIKQLLSAHRRPITSLGFGHNIGQASHFYDGYHYQQRKPYHRRRGKEKWYGNHCCSDVDNISAVEIDEWVNRVCKPLFELPESIRRASVHIYNDRRLFLEEVPRAQTTLLNASVAFIFQECRCLYLPRIPTASSASVVPLKSLAAGTCAFRIQLIKIRSSASSSCFTPAHGALRPTTCLTQREPTPGADHL